MLKSQKVSMVRDLLEMLKNEEQRHVLLLEKELTKMNLG